MQWILSLRMVGQCCEVQVSTLNHDSTGGSWVVTVG